MSIVSWKRIPDVTYLERRVYFGHCLTKCIRLRVSDSWYVSNPFVPFCGAMIVNVRLVAR